MEPITYANGSTLEDPAISYGIVFSNFMSKGVFTFEGGTDRLIRLMEEELKKSGVDIRINCNVEHIDCSGGRVRSVTVNGQTITCGAVMSNANLKQTIFNLVGEEHFDKNFVDDARIRLNNSSTQVYMALKPDETIDESTGDLLFSSTAPVSQTDLLLSRDITSRTFSFYYPADPAPGTPALPDRLQHERPLRRLTGRRGGVRSGQKQDLCETTLDALDKYVPKRRRAGRPRRGLDAADVQALHAAHRGGELRHEVRRPRGEPGHPAAGQRPVPCWERRHHHERLAGGDELRRDCGE